MKQLTLSVTHTNLMLELKLKLKSLEFQLAHFTNPRVLKCVFPGQRFIGGTTEIMEMIGMKKQTEV